MFQLRRSLVLPIGEEAQSLELVFLPLGEEAETVFGLWSVFLPLGQEVSLQKPLGEEAQSLELALMPLGEEAQIWNKFECQHASWRGGQSGYRRQRVQLCMLSWEIRDIAKALWLAWLARVARTARNVLVGAEHWAVGRVVDARRSLGLVVCGANAEVPWAFIRNLKRTIVFDVGVGAKASADIRSLDPTQKPTPKFSPCPL